MSRKSRVFVEMPNDRDLPSTNIHLDSTGVGIFSPGQPIATSQDPIEKIIKSIIDSTGMIRDILKSGTVEKADPWRPIGIKLLNAFTTTLGGILLSTLTAEWNDADEASVSCYKSILDMILRVFPEMISRQHKATGKMLIHQLCSKAGNLYLAPYMQMMLDSDRDCASKPDANGAYPIHYLVKNKSVNSDALSMLVRAFPDGPKMKDKKGFLPLVWAVNHDGHSATVVKEVIRLYPAAMREKSADGSLPLHWAVSRSNPSIEVIRMILNSYPTAARIANAEGRLPIHKLVRRCSKIEVIRLLMDVFPGSVKIASTDGQYALHKCLDRSSPAFDVFEILRRAHPDAVKIQDRNGYLPLHIALDCPHPNSSIVAKLIDLEPEALMTATIDGLLPLHFVLCANENPSITLVQTLVNMYPPSANHMAIDILPVDETADPSTWQGDWMRVKWTPLSRARERGLSKIVTVLESMAGKTGKPSKRQSQGQRQSLDNIRDSYKALFKRKDSESKEAVKDKGSSSGVSGEVGAWAGASPAGPSAKSGGVQAFSPITSPRTSDVHSMKKTVKDTNPINVKPSVLKLGAESTQKSSSQQGGDELLRKGEGSPAASAMNLEVEELESPWKPSAECDSPSKYVPYSPRGKNTPHPKLVARISLSSFDHMEEGQLLKKADSVKQECIAPQGAERNIDSPMPDISQRRAVDVTKNDFGVVTKEQIDLPHGRDVSNQATGGHPSIPSVVRSDSKAENAKSDSLSPYQSSSGKLFNNPFNSPMPKKSSFKYLDNEVTPVRADGNEDSKVDKFSPLVRGINSTPGMEINVTPQRIMMESRTSPLYKNRKKISGSSSTSSLPNIQSPSSMSNAMPECVDSLESLEDDCAVGYPIDKRAQSSEGLESESYTSLAAGSAYGNSASKMKIRYSGVPKAEAAEKDRWTSAKISEKYGVSLDTDPSGSGLLTESDKKRMTAVPSIEGFSKL